MDDLIYFLVLKMSKFILLLHQGNWLKESRQAPCLNFIQFFHLEVLTCYLLGSNNAEVKGNYRVKKLCFVLALLQFISRYNCRPFDCSEYEYQGNSKDTIRRQHAVVCASNKRKWRGTQGTTTPCRRGWHTQWHRQEENRYEDIWRESISRGG